VKTLVYLACPYSHASKWVMHERFMSVSRCAANLMRVGIHVFSPISHTHPIAQVGELPLDWSFWEAYDRAVLQCCSKLIVLKLHGWEHSVGVKAEVKIAKELGLPVEYMEEVK
jgi:hypothetical protein